MLPEASAMAAPIAGRERTGYESPSALPHPRSPLAGVALLGAAIGLAAYFMLGFNHLLAVHHIAWMLAPTVDHPYYDPGTMFLGWHFLRHASWKWPLTLDRSYGLELGSSVVFSDSIPLLAVFFKIFSPWLGPVFQYTGIWLLACFLLQGMFGALLGWRIAPNWSATAIIAAFLALSPVMLERSGCEYSLVGHWIVLWGLYLCLTPRTTNIRWVWLAPLFCAVGISFYFTPMVLALWGADALMAANRSRRIIKFLMLEAVAVGVTVYLSMWGFGYLVISSASATTDGFGKFAVNLLGPIDPWGWSNFFKHTDFAPNHLGEGYAYLGLGMILLAAMALLSLVRNPPPLRQWIRFWPLGAVLVAMAVFSLSNQIALGSRVLVLPNIWFKLSGIFRASGRLFWPFYYGLWLAIFFLVTRDLKPWRGAILLGLMFGVQYADIAPLFDHLHEENSARYTWRSPLQDPFWAVAVKKYDEIVVVPSGHMLPYVPLAFLAGSNGLSTNAVYVNRSPPGIGKTSDHRLQRLAADLPSGKVLYIVPEQDRFDELCSHLDARHGFGQINGYNIIAPYWFADGKSAAPGNLKPGTAPTPY
jgi:hypothetical protein